MSSFYKKNHSKDQFSAFPYLHPNYFDLVMASDNTWAFAFCSVLQRRRCSRLLLGFCLDHRHDWLEFAILAFNYFAHADESVDLNRHLPAAMPRRPLGSSPAAQMDFDDNLSRVAVSCSTMDEGLRWKPIGNPLLSGHAPSRAREGRRKSPRGHPMIPHTPSERCG